MTRLRDFGTLFDVLEERGSHTVVHLSRPFDIAPDGGNTYDIPALAGLVRDAAGWLAGAGARPGDRVAIVKENHWDYALLACAAARIGAVPAVLGNHLPAQTLTVLLRRLDAALLVTTRRTLDAVRNGGGDLTALARRTLCVDGPAPGTLSLDDVRGCKPPPPARRGDHDPLAIMHTSGTTGIPKLVVHSTFTMIHRIVGFETQRWPIPAYLRSDSVACASWFCHGRSTYGWTASVFWMQPREVLILADADPLVAEPFLRAHPPTTLEALPATLVRWLPLCAGSDNVFRNVRLYITTWDAIHPPAARSFLAASGRRLPLMLQVWGQTEAGPFTIRLLTRRALAKSGDRHPTTRNLGRPVPFRTRLRVVDPDNCRPVSAGHPGLVMARTKALGLGYIGEDERWAARVAGGWFSTGDIGVRTRAGSLRLLDREVDRIPGMSCVEIEDVLDDRLPDVLECVVLGSPGRLPLPVVVTADGSLDKSAWQAAVGDMPALDEPAALTWEQVPRTGTGKVRRTQLRELVGYGTATFGSGRWA